MDKKENERIKEYFFTDILKQIKRCPVMRRNFGDIFIEKRMKQNVKGFNTNVFHDEAGGYYKISDGIICVCKNDENGKEFTLEEIKQRESLKRIVIHESIHALFKKNQRECKRNKIKSGTGIFEISEKDNERGRGLNEGLTDWFCDKINTKNPISDFLTDMVGQIELAIGADNTAKIAKSNITRNLFKTLGITKEESNRLVNISDEYYVNLRKLQKLKCEYERIDLGKDKLEHDLEYQYFLDVNGLINDKKSKKAFIDREIEKTENQKALKIYEIESFVFDLYFKKEFEEFKHTQPVSKEQFDKFSKLYNKMHSDSKLKEDNPLSASSSLIFKKEFEEFRDKYLSEKINNSIEKIKAGTYSLQEYCEVMKLSDSTYEEFGDERVQDMQNVMGQYYFPANPNAFVVLIEALRKNYCIKDINKYSIQEYQTKNGSKVCLFSKDGVPIFSDDSYFNKIKHFKATDRVRNVREYMDFTIMRGQELRKIIDSFEYIKAEIGKRDPNANFTIFRKSILVTPSSKKEHIILALEGNDFVPTYPIQDQPTRVYMKHKSDESLALVIKNGFGDRLKNMFSKFFLRKKNTAETKNSESQIIYKEKNEPEEPKDMKELQEVLEVNVQQYNTYYINMPKVPDNGNIKTQTHNAQETQGDEQLEI